MSRRLGNIGMCGDGQERHFEERKPFEQRLTGLAGVSVVWAGAGTVSGKGLMASIRLVLFG